MDFKNQMNIICEYNDKINFLYAEWAKQHNISYNTMLTLFYIKLHKPCTQKQISEEWLIPKQTVNTVIKDLEKKGYVNISQGRNQKEKLISFTEEGIKETDKIFKDLTDLESHILEKIGEKNCEIIINSMKLFEETFEKEVKKYGK